MPRLWPEAGKACAYDPLLMCNDVGLLKRLHHTPPSWCVKWQQNRLRRLRLGWVLLTHSLYTDSSCPNCPKSRRSCAAYKTVLLEIESRLSGLDRKNSR